jgi:hypothetical protein
MLPLTLPAMSLMPTILDGTNIKFTYGCMENMHGKRYMPKSAHNMPTVALLFVFTRNSAHR